MDDQKIENLLNLALDATPTERDKSRDLETGYDRTNRTWEVIVRYSGDLKEAAPNDWRIVALSGGYAIVTLPQTDVDLLGTCTKVLFRILINLSDQFFGKSSIDLNIIGTDSHRAPSVRFSSFILV